MIITDFHIVSQTVKAVTCGRRCVILMMKYLSVHFSCSSAQVPQLSPENRTLVGQTAAEIL